MSTEMLLIVRADASVEIGAGHVMRCLALAQAWQDAGGTATFVSREIPESLCDRLETENMRLLTIDCDRGSAADAEALVTILHQSHAAAVVLDGYAFGSDYRSVIADRCCVSLAVEDHAHSDNCVTDFVLNQNAGVTPGQYTNPGPDTELLLGPEFALLRREFTAGGAAAKKTPSHAHHVLVSLGGSDPHNTTEVVMEGLQRLTDQGLRVRVIVGGLNPFAERISQLCKSDDRFAFLSDVQDMSVHYQWADLAITAGGSSNWEMCPAGVPRIVIVTADNQHVIAEYLHTAEIGVNLGDAAGVTAGQVQDVTTSLLPDTVWRERAAAGARALVDGRGARRCVDRLQQKILSNSPSCGVVPDR